MSELVFLQNLKENLNRRDMACNFDDDCAHLPPNNSPWVITTDMIVEGTHFDLAHITPYHIGRKALAVNLSDLAAKGAKPSHFFLSLCLNSNHPSSFEEALVDGILDLAQQFEVQLAGGDTNYWHSPLAINITLLGTAHPKVYPSRSNAKVGDLIIVTGDLGDTIHHHHHSFVPRVKEAIAILDHVEVHAMADISDGLATDLGNILKASQVGARLFAEKIPVKKNLKEAHPAEKALEFAMTDGEDFELVFCLPRGEWSKLVELNLPEIKHLNLHCVGEITQAAGLRLVKDGKESAVNWKGFEHA